MTSKHIMIATGVCSLRGLALPSCFAERPHARIDLGSGANAFLLPWLLTLPVALPCRIQICTHSVNGSARGLCRAAHYVSVRIA